jgi:pyridoxamine 5'-phosphate oxidase
VSKPAAGSIGQPVEQLPATLPSDPWDLLVEWLPANDHPDRPQITVSTISADGGPDARTVLLTEFDREGFYFHTDALSRKAADIHADPRVAITVLWPNFTRQLVIQGRAEVAPAAEIAAAYSRRSPYLQQLAWQNTQSFAELPADVRRTQWAAFLAEHATGFAQPDNWLGFLVRPHRLTFWGSNPDTASRRAEYTLVDGEWVLGYLPG